MNQTDEYDNSIEDTKWAIEKYKQWLLENMENTIKVDFRGGPSYADFDYYVDVNGIFNHYIEVKVRRNNFYKYDTVKLPLRKHTFAEHIINSSEMTTSKFLCLFDNSVLAFCDLAEEPSEVKVITARYDRGESTDLYALYHQSRFKIIWTN